MLAEYVDWGICLFFFGALIAVNRFGPTIIAVDKRAFAHITIGVALLSTMSLLRVFHTIGLLASIPFLAEPIFHHLITSIVLVTGLTFLVGGMSSWLLVRGQFQRHHGRTIRQLEIIKQVEQLAQVENRLDALLLIALELVVVGYGFQSGTVIKISSRSGKVRAVGTVGGICYPAKIWLAARFNIARWQTLSDIAPDQLSAVMSLPRGAVSASAIIPILVQGSPVGMFLFGESPTGKISRSELQKIHVVADIIARRIELDRRQLCIQHLTERSQFHQEIEKAVCNHSEIQAAVPALVSAVRAFIPADIVSLVSFQTAAKLLTRYTTTGGGALVEHKVAIPNEQTVTGHLFQHGETVVVTDARETTMLAPDGPFASAGIRSIMAIPITADGTCTGALILGHAGVQTYSTRHGELLELVTPALARLLHANEFVRIQKAQTNRTERRLRFLSQESSGKSVHEFAHGALEFLSAELGFDCARIALLEEGGQFLRSLATVGRGMSPHAVPGDGLLVLSLLDCHRAVIDSAAPAEIVSRASESSISHHEMAQVFGYDCSAMRILPLMSEGDVVGVLSLGRTFSEAPALMPVDEAFLGATVAHLSHMLTEPASSRRPTVGLRGVERAIEANRSERELRNRLRSPLTGILGSLELLRGQASREEGDLDRYLNIMDKSARRMQDYLDRQESTVR